MFFIFENENKKKTRAKMSRLEPIRLDYMDFVVVAVDRDMFGMEHFILDRPVYKSIFLLVLIVVFFLSLGKVNK